MRAHRTQRTQDTRKRVPGAPVALKPLAAHTPPATFFQGPSGMRSGTAGMLKLSAAVETSARTRSGARRACGVQIRGGATYSRWRGQSGSHVCSRGAAATAAVSSQWPLASSCQPPAVCRRGARRVLRAARASRCTHLARERRAQSRAQQSLEACGGAMRVLGLKQARLRPPGELGSRCMPDHAPRPRSPSSPALTGSHIAGNGGPHCASAPDRGCQLSRATPQAASSPARC